LLVNFVCFILWLLPF